MNPTFHRGAVVSVRPSDVPEFTRAKCLRMFRGQQAMTERGDGLLADHLAAVAKPSRQRRKGAITRYGVQR